MQGGPRSTQASPGQPIPGRVICAQEFQGPCSHCLSRTYANVPHPTSWGVTTASLLWLKDRLGTLPPQMSGALAQESTSQSWRRPKVGHRLGEETVSPTIRDFQVKS